VKLYCDDVVEPLFAILLTGEVRNIDKRKTNVKTELMIEVGSTYIEGGYENVSIGFWEGMEYVLEISFILHPPLVITL
jgi:hypothetical protein